MGFCPKPLTTTMCRSLSLISGSRTGTTPEQLKARCLEHYKDRISADGPYRLVLEITDNFKTPPNAKPSLGLLVSLYNRAFSPLDQVTPGGGLSPSISLWPPHGAGPPGPAWRVRCSLTEIAKVNEGPHPMG